jgi:hypothetical protein
MSQEDGQASQGRNELEFLMETYPKEAPPALKPGNIAACSLTGELWGNSITYEVFLQSALFTL